MYVLYMCTCMHMCTFLYVCVHACEHACMGVCVCVCVDTFNILWKTCSFGDNDFCSCVDLIPPNDS